MVFDLEYYTRIHAFINKQDNARYKIEALTNDPVKFIFHLKYYIENRDESDLIIELIENDTELIIPELFESKIKEREDLIRKIVNTFDLVEIKKQRDTTLEKQATNPYKADGLFQ